MTCYHERLPWVYQHQRLDLEVMLCRETTETRTKNEAKRLRVNMAA